MNAHGLVSEGFISNPDLTRVASLMEQAWPQPCWRYTVPMLAGYHQRPGAEPALGLGYRCGAELAGYMAYLPCPVQYDGRPWRMVFASFWTALGHYGLKNIPLRLHAELHRQACAMKYQGLLTIGEEGSKGVRAFKLVSQRLGLPYQTISRFGMLLGLPRLARRRLAPGHAGRRVQLYTSRWRAQCATLAAAATRQARLGRIFGAREFTFLLHDRPGSRTWLWQEDGQVRGLLNGWAQRILGTPDHDAFQFDHILLDGLDPREQVEFLGAVFTDPFWEELDAVHVPLTGMFSEEPFKQAGFMISPKTFQLNYLPYPEGPTLECVNSFYLEFF